VKLELVPIARDALVFITNSANPVTSLTIEQAKGIYSGAVTDWSEVGGQPGAIMAYQRPSDSGSHQLLEKLVMDGTPVVEAPQGLVLSSMGDMIEEIASYQNGPASLGYSVYYFVANMNPNEAVKMLDIEGVTPSSSAISSGEYPLTNRIFAAYRADEPAGSPVRQIVDWILSDEGQAALVDAGYVPYK
jgi:phosphate transport system substrate-binding protein